MELVKRS